MRVTAILLFASATLFPLTPCPAVTVADISQHPMVRITHNPHVDWMPTLSAEGNRLAWSGPEEGQLWWEFDVYVADRIGGKWQQPLDLGTPGVREWFPDLSDDGDTIVYAGGHYQGACDEVHIRSWVDEVWQPPAAIANTLETGYNSVERCVISGDGSTVIARLAVSSPTGARNPYDSIIIRRRNGTWANPALVAEKGRSAAVNGDGTRVCVADAASLDLYDFAAIPPRKWVLEQRDPNVWVFGCTMSDDGRRVAYEWYRLAQRHAVRLREEQDGQWSVMEFPGFFMGALSKDGTALVLLPGFDVTEISLSRLTDGQWHEPICIADTGVYPDYALPAVNGDGTKIAVAASPVRAGGRQQAQEIYFLEYDFPGRVVTESNIPNAPFTLSGPIELSRTTGPDSRWQCDQLYVSNWTVTWGDVPFYETPPPQTQRTAVDETVFFCGQYIPSIFRPEPDEVELSIGTPVLNYATGTFFVPVEIRNMTEDTTFFPPMRLVFDSFSLENTSLWNGDGLTEDGKPFIDLSGLVPDGLAPDSPHLLVEVEIYNRERNPLISFEAFVTAAKAPPPERTCSPEAVQRNNAISGSRGIEHQSTPRVESIALDKQGIKIAWRSIAGQNYRVLYCDNVFAEWQTAAEVTASGATTEWIDETVSETPPRMRMYKVQAISCAAALRPAFQ